MSKKRHPCAESTKAVLALVQSSMRWVSKGNESRRIHVDELDVHLAQGWEPGRHSFRANGFGFIGRGGEERRVASTITKIRKHGFTEEQIRQAWLDGLQWCSDCSEFCPSSSFKPGYSRCNRAHSNSSDAWYRLKLEEQGGMCAICSTTPQGRALARDHNHECVRHKDGPALECACLRGLLCSTCNFQLGYFERFIKCCVATPQFLPDTWEAGALAYLAHYQLSNP